MFVVSIIIRHSQKNAFNTYGDYDPNDRDNNDDIREIKYSTKMSAYTILLSHCTLNVDNGETA